MSYNHEYHFLSSSCIHCGNKEKDITQKSIPCFREDNIIPITHTRSMQILKEVNENIRSSIQDSNTNSE